MQNGALCVIFAGPAGTVAPFYNMDLTDKSWIVHLYPTRMELRGGSALESNKISQGKRCRRCIGGGGMCDVSGFHDEKR